MKETCSTCYFFLRESTAPPTEDDTGLCLRYAPRPGDRNPVWPEVQAYEGCGEHETEDFYRARRKAAILNMLTANDREQWSQVLTQEVYGR